MAIYIKGATLAWPHIWGALQMEKDKGGRWYPTESTPDYVREYLADVRSPSRSWPNSYAQALLRQKFAKFLTDQDPETAIRCGVAE